jgi:hypothetical protein
MTLKRGRLAKYESRVTHESKVDTIEVVPEMRVVTRFSPSSRSPATLRPYVEQISVSCDAVSDLGLDITDAGLGFVWRFYAAFT